MNTRQPHSPPGTTPATRHPTEQATDAAPNARQPGGEPINDLLGGEARPAKRMFDFPRYPTAADFQAFADWIDAELANGVSGKVLRADNEYALRTLKGADADLYDAVQGRLAA
jgi:hypothetical protein